MKTLVPPLKVHGGKRYLADWIISMMPPRCANPNKPDDKDDGWLHYVEPYFGGGQVLFRLDPKGISEIANDLNEHLTNFWQVLQSPTKFNRFLKLAQTTPFSGREYRKASAQLHDLSDDPERAALQFFVRCRQSLAGRMKGFTGITKTRTRRGMNNEASAWLSVIDGLPEVHKRLRRVLILEPQSAIDVIRKQDGPRTLFYLDCPYLHSTRATTKEYGMYEMNDDDHEELLSALSKVTGRFILSGYRSKLYDAACKKNKWRREEQEIANHSAGGKQKRRMIESIWLNY